MCPRLPPGYRPQRLSVAVTKCDGPYQPGGAPTGSRGPGHGGRRGRPPRHGAQRSPCRERWLDASVLSARHPTRRGRVDPRSDSPHEAARTIPVLGSVLERKARGNAMMIGLEGRQIRPKATLRNLFSSRLQKSTWVNMALVRNLARAATRGVQGARAFSPTTAEV